MHIAKKKCTKCNYIIDLSNFYKRKSGKLSSTCKSCDILSSRKIKKRKSSTILGHLTVILSNSKRNARKTNKIHLITLDDLVELYTFQRGLCALTNIKLTNILGNGHVNTNISIDRIDSSKGYTKENIQLVCFIINIMKNNLSMNEFKHWCNLILNKE